MRHRSLACFVLILSVSSGVGLYFSRRNHSPRKVTFEVVIEPGDIRGPGLSVVVDNSSEIRPYVELRGTRSGRFEISPQQYDLLLSQVETDGIWSTQNARPTYDLSCRVLKGSAPEKVFEASNDRRHSIDEKVKSNFCNQPLILGFLKSLKS